VIVEIPIFQSRCRDCAFGVCPVGTVRSTAWRPPPPPLGLAERCSAAPVAPRAGVRWTLMGISGTKIAARLGMLAGDEEPLTRRGAPPTRRQRLGLPWLSHVR
jgi:hypothetical protein